MTTIANKQPRGWVVAKRLKPCRRARCSLCAPWQPAYDGAVFANRAMAARKAELLQARNLAFNVRVLREGLVK